MPDGTEPRPALQLEIRITTPLSAATADDIGGLLDNAVTLRPAHLIIDLTDCEYLDATGIGLLLDIHRRTWQSGGRLSLRGMSPRLRRILKLARVDRVLHTATPPARYRPEHGPPTTEAAPFGTTH
jgi:anti-anti-sigma factor